MSYSATSSISRGRFWPALGPRLPLNKISPLGIAAVLAVTAAVFLTWMFAAGPWSGGDGSFSKIESGRSGAGFGGGAIQAAAPVPAGFRGDSELSVTITNDSYSGAPAFGLPKPGVEEGVFPTSGAAGPSVINTSGQRQVISQGSMSVEVPDVAHAAARVRAIAEGAGGFVEQLSSHGVGEFQESTLTVRVPQAEFFSVFEQIKALGKVQSENAGSEDVSERFIDLEARLRSAQREELSLLSLLDRAERISEILIIEQELTRVRTELERVQGQLNFLERRVDLATITVFLSPPPRAISQAPSGSLTIETSTVNRSVDAVKALVAQVDGEIDRVFTSVQDGHQRALMTVRVFAEDFSLLVAAVEDQGGLVSKEVQEGKAGDSVSRTTGSGEPDARLDITFQELESSTLGRNLAIFVPLGGAGLMAALGAMLYGAYRMGMRRED